MGRMGSASEVGSGNDPSGQNGVRRIALISVLSDVNDAALRFLVLQLNAVQRSFEFEFVPFDPADTFLRTLRSRRGLERTTVEKELQRFYDRQLDLLDRLSMTYGTSEPSAEGLLLLTTAKLTDNYYLTRHGRISIVALGNWRRSMAPPSIIEFILSLVVADAVARVSPRLSSEGHLGTKGCLGDFAASLSDARQQVLSSYLCRYCRSQLAADGRATIVPDIEAMFPKRWLGSLSDPASPASVASALGYDLFVVKGLKPTVLESLRVTLHQEGWRQLIALAAGVVLAALLVFLGLD